MHLTQKKLNLNRIQENSSWIPRSGPRRSLPWRSAPTRTLTRWLLHIQKLLFTFGFRQIWKPFVSPHIYSYRNPLCRPSSSGWPRPARGGRRRRGERGRTERSRRTRYFHMEFNYKKTSGRNFKGFASRWSSTRRTAWRRRRTPASPPPCPRRSAPPPGGCQSRWDNDLSVVSQ